MTSDEVGVKYGGAYHGKVICIDSCGASGWQRKMSLRRMCADEDNKRPTRS
jgi:hypothetical protein